MKRFYIWVLIIWITVGAAVAILGLYMFWSPERILRLTLITMGTYFIGFVGAHAPAWFLYR
jgi:hypothetical protein